MHALRVDLSGDELVGKRSTHFSAIWLRSAHGHLAYERASVVAMQLPKPSPLPVRLAAPVDVRHAARAPLTIAAMTLTSYAVWLASYLGSGHSIWGLVLVGRRFEPRFPHAVSGTGYDGQWYYRLAIDPLHAASLLDKPAYRYLRILYPLLARVAALGRADLIPYTLVVVNILAVAGGTLAVAVWLQRRGLSPSIALVYGLFPGLFTAVARDVADPLAFGLVAVAIALLDRSVVWAALAFGLAAFTRESTCVFPVGYAAAALLHGWRGATRAVLLVGVGVLPLLAYKLFLTVSLGSAGIPSEDLPVLIPLQGIFTWWPWKGAQVEAVVSIVIPTLICTGALIAIARHRHCTTEMVLLGLNCVLFVYMLHATSFGDLFGSLRVTTGVVLSAILCIPVTDRVLRSRRWFWTSVPFWLALAPVMFVLDPLSLVAR